MQPRMDVGLQPLLQSCHPAPPAEPAQKKQRTAAASTMLDASTAADTQATAVAVEAEIISPLRPGTTEAADGTFDEAAAEAAKEAAHDDNGAALLADSKDASWILEQAEALRRIPRLNSDPAASGSAEQYHCSHRPCKCTCPAAAAARQRPARSHGRR